MPHSETASGLSTLLVVCGQNHDRYLRALMAGDLKASAHYHTLLLDCATLLLEEVREMAPPLAPHSLAAECGPPEDAANAVTTNHG